MIIKKYIDFIKEDKKGFSNLGEWIDSLSDDEYVMDIVNRYLKDFDPAIELSNAINLLDDREKADIKSQVEKYLSGGIEDKDPVVLTSTRNINVFNSTNGTSNQVGFGLVGDKFIGESIEEITVSGKGVFTSFLKVLTALGRKESKPNYKDCPEDFLLFYYYDELNCDDVNSIFSRFKSLSRYSNIFDYQKNQISLYFGVRCDGQFEYGFGYDNLTPMGRFKLSKSTIKWIVQLQSKSAESLKKELVNLSFNDITILGNIKRDMKDFNPGYHESKLYPYISDKIISFGYKGVGKWDNGKLDQGEYINIKNNFSTWVLNKKWGDKVLVSIQPKSFWLNIHLKLK